MLIALYPKSLLAQDGRDQPDLMDMSLEDLMKVEVDSVYGTSGYKQKVTDAPASITVITADEIQRHGYRTLADILRNVPGFYVTYDRDYSYLGERGFGRPGDYNSRVLLLIDGHRTDDPIFNAAFIGTESPLDIDLIDRVEVIRGPNSSIYVASAFLGVINIITKPVRKQKELTASGEVASYGTYKSRLTYGHEFRDGLGLILSGSFYDSAGQNLFFQEFDSPATNYGIAENCDYEESHQAFASLTYGDLRFQGLFGSREKGVPTAFYGSLFNDPAARTVDARGYLDLSYDHKFGSDWGYLGRVYYDDYRYHGYYPYVPGSNGSAPVMNKDAPVGQWWGAEFALSKHLFDNQTLVVGSEYRDNFRESQTNYDVQPYFQYFVSQPTSYLWGIYAQDEIRLHPSLTMDLGLRYDHYSTFGGTTNPRGALIYQPFEKTTFKLLYGQSFRAPNAFELYYAGQGQEGNLHLRPETAKTTELVLEQYLQSDVRLSVSGYYYPLRGLISQETDPSNGNIVYQNSQGINMRGVEVSLKKESRSGLEAVASLSLQDAHQVGNSTPLTNSPHVLSQNNLTVPLLKRKLFASMNLDYVSRRRTWAGNDVGAYFLPDFTLFSRATRHWEVAASLYNAFNKKCGDPGTTGDPEDIIYQDGRSYRLKFTYHF
jgi:iron complex outermembrane receptor protein